jgi:hypothetical protein
MKDLLKKGGGHSPLPEDSDVFCRLAVVKKTLEWIHPRQPDHSRKATPPPAAIYLPGTALALNFTN